MKESLIFFGMWVALAAGFCLLWARIMDATNPSNDE